MLECDYLIVGAGASGMAFADTVVSESNDRTVILIDKLSEPGGHWNHAYDFVRLHQPACFYGVPSEKLERDGQGGHRYQDLSSKQELLTYFRMVLDKLVKTGRVQHFGGCTYQQQEKENDEHCTVHSFIDKEGITQKVKVKRRLVDATYQKIQVPSTHPPRYKVQKGVECIPINGIYGIKADDSSKKFVLIGSGKTGIDAALYLLDVGIDPEHITWIMPRDAWWFCREFMDPQTVLLRYSTYFNQETTLKKSLLKAEADGAFFRLDTTVWPEKYSCATVETSELQKLRTITNIVRKGRVKSIDSKHLLMENGDKIPYQTGSIVVDCSARGLPPQPPVPIFQPHKIVLQPVIMCLICLGAAAAAYLDCHPEFSDDDDRNRLMIPVPYPNTTRDSIAVELGTYRNQFLGIGADPRTKHWYNNCRLKDDSHSNWYTLLQLFAGRLHSGFVDLPASLDAKKAQYQQAYNKEFPHPVYSTQQMNDMLKELRMLTVYFYALLLGGLVITVVMVHRFILGA